MAAGYYRNFTPVPEHEWQSKCTSYRIVCDTVNKSFTWWNVCLTHKQAERTKTQRAKCIERMIHCVRKWVGYMTLVFTGLRLTSIFSVDVKRICARVGPLRFYASTNIWHHIYEKRWCDGVDNDYEDVDGNGGHMKASVLECICFDPKWMWRPFQSTGFTITHILEYVLFASQTIALS